MEQTLAGLGKRNSDIIGGDARLDGMNRCGWSKLLFFFFFFFFCSGWRWLSCDNGVPEGFATTGREAGGATAVMHWKVLRRLRGKRGASYLTLGTPPALHHTSSPTTAAGVIEAVDAAFGVCLPVSLPR